MKAVKTTIELPANLLEEAKAAAGLKTKTQAIVLALQEFIQRRKSRKILELRGKIAFDFDYKASRRKR